MAFQAACATNKPLPFPSARATAGLAGVKGLRFGLGGLVTCFLSVTF
jgi:hypothetical protein